MRRKKKDRHDGLFHKKWDNYLKKKEKDIHHGLFHNKWDIYLNDEKTSRKL